LSLTNCRLAACKSEDSIVVCRVMIELYVEELLEQKD